MCDGPTRLRINVWQTNQFTNKCVTDQPVYQYTCDGPISLRINVWWANQITIKCVMAQMRMHMYRGGRMQIFLCWHLPILNPLTLTEKKLACLARSSSNTAEILGSVKRKADASFFENLQGKKKLTNLPTKLPSAPTKLLSASICPPTMVLSSLEAAEIVDSFMQSPFYFCFENSFIDDAELSKSEEVFDVMEQLRGGVEFRLGATSQRIRVVWPHHGSNE